MQARNAAMQLIDSFAASSIASIQKVGNDMQHENAAMYRELNTRCKLKIQDLENTTNARVTELKTQIETLFHMSRIDDVHATGYT